MRRDERILEATELSQMEGGEDLAVTCTCCESQFEAFALSQAEGCAADIEGTTITGFYGSAVADRRRFLFVDGRQPEHLASGQICDECISQLISDGAIIESGEMMHPFIDQAVRRRLVCH